jgi:uncharacterized sporulation protein YeaH/YhbH (DUF444 family)
MPHFVDRRLNPKDKSLGNRRRFIRRVRASVKKAVDESVRRRSIADIDREEKVKVPTEGISEPSFQHAAEGGRRERVLTGNKDFRTGRARTTSSSSSRARSSSTSSSRTSSCPTW